MNPLSGVLRQPRERRRLLVESGLAMLAAAWRVRTWGFARLAASLGDVAAPVGAQAHDGTEAPIGSESDLSFARELRWALGAWERALPLQPTCLMYAVAARSLLARRGIGCELYFGVRGAGGPDRSLNRQVTAHAWLRCGPLLITGASEAASFKPIAVYRCKPPSSKASS